MNGGARSKFEPLTWLVVFQSKSSMWWINRFVPGRFKHVVAAGWVEASKVWIFYEVYWGRTSVQAMPEAEGTAYFGRLMGADPDAAVLRVEAREARPACFRLGFWCVPAVKHLVGLRSGALRPDRLWRDCIASGAEIVHDRSKRTVVSAVAAGDRGAEGR